MNGPRRPRTVMDPSALALGGVYAEGLLEAVGRNESAEEAADQLEAIVGLMDTVEGFETLLTAAVIGREERLAMMRRIFAGCVAEPVEAVLMLLARANRLNILRAMVQRFREKLNRREGKLPVTVITAGALSSDRRENLSAELAEALGAEPLLETRVEPELIGGVKIQVGDRVFDASVAGELERMKESLRARMKALR